MKKSKLLIPALSIASVGAVVAPMVTSCTKASGLSYQYFKEGKLADQYKATITAKTAGEPFEKYEGSNYMTPACIAYINDVKANPNILADDVLVAIYSIIKDATTYTNWTLGVSNVSIDKTLRVEGLDAPLLSGTIKIELEHNGEKNKGDKEIATVSFKNVISGMKFDNEGKNPEIGLFGASSVALSALLQSNISFDYHYVDKDSVEQTHINFVCSNVMDIAAISSLLSSDIDDSIKQIVSMLLNSDSQNPITIPSAYFAKQTEETA